MQRFFENKLAFAAVLLLFALAMVCNATIGDSNSKTNDWNASASAVAQGKNVVQKGPNVPPDPWEGLLSNVTVQKGPNVPPDPWEGNKIQKGPNVPPDPWEGLASNVTVHKGPNVPPDPWEGNKVHKGPNVPPDPWEGARAA
jgi:hypothetical protein